MIKRFAIGFVLILLASSCSFAEASADLDGTWVTDDRADTQIAAEIKDGEIVMEFTDENASALYWKGDFPETAEDGETIISDGDTAIMDDSLLASMDDTKEFLLKDGALVFDMSMLGVTQTILLTKDK